MKSLIKCVVLSLVIGVPQGCDLVDPTEVINPNIVQDVVVGTPNSTTLIIVGLDRQMAAVYNGLVDIAEVGSDNYVNTQTFFNQNFDVLDIQFKDTDINTLQARIANLRVGAEFGINDIYPGDNVSTQAQLAELNFYHGWSLLLAGEMFNALPAEGETAAISSSANIALAITDFQAAEAIDGTNASYKMALARAYYVSGDKANAVIKANEAIAIDAAYLRAVEYDAINGPTSTIQDALQDRGNFDDYQPLPSLDFLDPKAYARPGGTEESPTYIQKIEEAHLILAEAQIADSDLPGARQTMKDIIALVGTRVKDTFDDSVEGRTNEMAENRPDTVTTMVRYGTEPFRSGLVLNRLNGDVTVGTISDTSLDDAYVDALLTEDAVLEGLYLLRQEIFMAEGRRFTDLGIKLPVSEVEMLSNSLISASDVLASVPSFLPLDMDAITYDASTPGSETCTITYNMNAVLAANKTDAAVLPFH